MLELKERCLIFANQLNRPIYIGLCMLLISLSQRLIDRGKAGKYKQGTETFKLWTVLKMD